MVFLTTLVKKDKTSSDPRNFYSQYFAILCQHKCCLVLVWLRAQWLDQAPRPQVDVCFIYLQDLICLFYTL